MHESSHPIGHLVTVDGETKWSPYCKACTQPWPCEASVLIAERDDFKKKLLELEGALCWDTTCLNCASLLDKSYADYVRADKAEAEVQHLRAQIAEVADEFDGDADWPRFEPMVRRLRTLLEDGDH